VNEPLLEMRGIGKSYGPVRALDDVALDLERGEVLGIVGENGAGKSTLMKILGGAEPADSGTIVLDGATMKTAQTRAALAAGMTRLRPVMMTALAMIIGMLPMAIGLGEGGEQNAPLGRAVVGGLLFSTITTLTVLPTIYAALQGNVKTQSNSLNPEDPASRYYANS